MSEGYVYVLSNPSMPGIVKIGRSKHGGRVRAKDLYAQATGVPTPFKMEFELWSKDCEEAEILCHEELQKERVNESREFFVVDVYDAIKTVISVYAGTMDCQIGHCDSSVSEADVDIMCYDLERIGKQFAHPEVAEALGDMKPEIVYERIIERRKSHLDWLQERRPDLYEKVKDKPNFQVVK